MMTPRPTRRTPAQLQIELEDTGARSWLHSLLTTLTGPYATRTYRFVARPHGLGPAVVYTSDTFALQPRQLPLTSLKHGDAWADDVRAALADLDTQLRADGWTPIGLGPRWWSLRYHREPARRAGEA